MRLFAHRFGDRDLTVMPAARPASKSTSPNARPDRK
jgi:hypothetical protein